MWENEVQLFVFRKYLRIIPWQKYKSISNDICKGQIFSIIENDTIKRVSNGFFIAGIFFGLWTVAHQVWWDTVHSSNDFFLL